MEATIRRAGLLVPQLLETGNKLGDGSYGEVVEVRVGGKLYAGKRLHAFFYRRDVPPAEARAISKRFEEECLRLPQLKHDNVVQILGVHFNSANRPMLVMELLNVSLSSYLEREPATPPRVKNSILLGAAKGLEYLHTLSPPLGPIVHRDLTANNVLLTTNLIAKIADLGQAKIVGRNPAQLARRNPWTMCPGNMAHMPPEALFDTPVYDTKLDVFSFGVVMLHTLTQEWPEPLSKLVSTHQVRNEIERRKNYLDKISSPILKPIVMQCLNDNPDLRPSAEDLVAVLDMEVRLLKQELALQQKTKDYQHLLRYNQQQYQRNQHLLQETQRLQKEKHDLQQDLEQASGASNREIKQLTRDKQILQQQLSRELEMREEEAKMNCPVCYESFPMDEMISMPGCTDSLCKDCFKMHFKATITEKGVRYFNCPLCDKPDMTDRDDAMDLYQELFVHLIHVYLPEQYGLMQYKLTELNLQKDPGFRWCLNCGECFINPNLARKKVECPTCQALLCFQCQRKWDPKHDYMSCEAFAEWKNKNNPEFQRRGLAAYLEDVGIECPTCHMRHELGKAGCMHMKCTRCPEEFCSSCGNSFKKAERCGRFQSCATMGFHAHHPRNCLYYMRDFDIEELQPFLYKNNVEFKTTSGNDMRRCDVMNQKETPDKLIDEKCGDRVQEGHAGLCVKHYKEYLVLLINKAELDPLPMYDTDKIVVILKREEKEVPEREDETDEEYRARLIKHVKQELPLQILK